MIPFDSPEGAALRALNPSLSAALAIWLAALERGADSWAHWARERVSASSADADVLAMRFLQAAQDGDERAARQLWAVLGSLPQTGQDSAALRAARRVRARLSF